MGINFQHRLLPCFLNPGPLPCSEAEREHAGDRERWQREGAARQEAAVAAAAAAAGANTADVVARRALLENEVMAAELAYQSRQARGKRAHTCSSGTPHVCMQRCVPSHCTSALGAADSAAQLPLQ